MTVMSATPARFASSSLVQPLSAMSSAIRCASNCTGSAAMLAVVDIRKQEDTPPADHCQQQNADICQQSEDGLLGCASVPTRSIFHAEFGRYMEGLRTAKAWSQSDAARFAAKKYPHITRNVIVHVEAGKARDPKPALLRDLANLYGVPYEEVARQFFRDKYGNDPIRHRGAVQPEGNKNEAGGVLPENPPLSHQSQTPEGIDAGFVASPRILSAHAIDDIGHASDALLKISEEINRWSAKLGAILSDTLDPPPQDSVAGGESSIHSDALRETHRPVASKKRRSGR
jgi:transcriptional regulator with XRE-family HTH domain